MDIDVAYHIDNKNNIFKHLKTWIRPKSIKFTYIGMDFDDLYYLHKILYNLHSLLEDAGFIVVDCDIRSVSDIFKFCQSHFSASFYKGYDESLFVVASNSGFVPIHMYDEQWAFDIFLSRMSKTNDNILIIDSHPEDIIKISKNLCRNVISFTDCDYNIYEGIVNVCLEDE